MISRTRRFSGFQRTLRASGAASVIDRITGTSTVEYVLAATGQLLKSKPRPTAVFATSTEIVIGCLDALREATISDRQEVSIVGFDDVSPLHPFASAVTTVRQPIRSLGKRALELSLDTDEDSAEELPKDELLLVTLTGRDSVAPPIGTRTCHSQQ